MKVGFLNEVIKDMEAGVFDYTKNSECSNCGNCCADLLPISQDEICRIREYIKKDGRVIFEVSNAVAPDAAKYTLQVVFDAIITESRSQYTASGVSMDKVTTTLEWSLSGIEKGVV